MKKRFFKAVIIIIATYVVWEIFDDILTSKFYSMSEGVEYKYSKLISVFPEGGKFRIQLIKTLQIALGFIGSIWAIFNEGIFTKNKS